MPKILPHRNGFSPVVILILFSFVVLVVLLVVGLQAKKTGNSSTKACTQEAKICPDGSSVGRSGPACEFSPCPSVPPVSSDVDTSDWMEYKSEPFGFSIKHPQDLEIEEEIDHVELYKYGPTQKQNTEGYDLLSLRFHAGSLDGQTLKEFVDSEYEKSKENATILKPMTETTIGNIKGFTYSVRGLGEFTYYYVSSGNDQYIWIIDATRDPSDQRFDESAKAMLSTFTLLR